MVFSVLKRAKPGARLFQGLAEKLHHKSLINRKMKHILYALPGTNVHSSIFISEK